MIINFINKFKKMNEDTNTPQENPDELAQAGAQVGLSQAPVEEKEEAEKKPPFVLHGTKSNKKKK